MTNEDETRHAIYVDLRAHYLKAAAYDVAYARTADTYARYDQSLQTGITVITSLTAGGVIGTFLTTDGWPKTTALVLSAIAALLSAIRQGSNWGGRSEVLRKQGAAWSAQREDARDYITRLLTGREVPEEKRTDLKTKIVELVANNQEVRTELYQQCKREKEREFNKEYAFTPLNAPKHSSAANQALA